MTKDTRIWMLILGVGLALVAIRCLVAGQLVGKEYVRNVTTTWIDPDGPGGANPWVEARSDEAKGIDVAALPASERRDWTAYRPATPLDYAEARAMDPAQTTVFLSVPRTIGLWFAAFLTLALFSFMYRDNPFYKVAESVFIGVSAAYWMVVAFHAVLIPNLLGKIAPAWVSTWAMPGLKEERNLMYIAPLILGAMLLWRLSPKGGWIARWPLALFIGVFCGLRLVGYLQADFVSQIRNAIVPLYALGTDGSFDFWLSLKNFFLVGGVLTCLVYFFFSFEHKGLVGGTARVGIWVLMITFGAGFGYTVMGRIALLAIRLEFLFDDWLWLVDPTHKRADAEVAASLTAFTDTLAGLD